MTYLLYQALPKIFGTPSLIITIKQKATPRGRFFESLSSAYSAAADSATVALAVLALLALLYMLLA